MINLGEAPEQKEGGKGPIPPKSIVLVKMEIRNPKTSDPSDPAVSVFKTGLKGLDCEFTVVSGQFEGKTMWENWFLPPGLQTVNLTKGQKGICDGSFAKMRAVIEAVRRLDPADPAADRSISSWFDLNDLVFAVKVGVDQPKPGDQYINNRIDKVLTLADEHFETVMAGGEVISTEPLPEIPAAPAQPQAPPPGGQWSAPGGNVNQRPEVPPQSAPPPTNVPAWAR